MAVVTSVARDEVLADALEGGTAPRQQRTNASEKEQEESDGHSHAVVERSAYRDLAALHILRDDRE
jgi:hypothetical protein